MNPKDVIELRTARQCLASKLINCDNEQCLNKCCPLNKFWDNSGFSISEKENKAFQKGLNKQ